jgi:hypothetical protein
MTLTVATTTAVVGLGRVLAPDLPVTIGIIGPLVGLVAMNEMTTDGATAATETGNLPAQSVEAKLLRNLSLLKMNAIGAPFSCSSSLPDSGQRSS